MRVLKKIITRVLIFVILIFIISSAIGFVVYSIYPLYYKDYIGEYSIEHSLDPYLVAAIINTESSFNKDAQSPKNAKGLMQITDQTGQWAAEQLGLEDYENKDLFDPELNIEIGTWYLEKLEKEFDGDLNKMLAAYNGGSGNVNKWLRDEEYSKDGKNLDKIPFKETENYVKKVKADYEAYKKIYESINFVNEGYDSSFIEYIYILKDHIKNILK